ncbi:MAG: hypothetical protein FJX42_06220, partial [Alphaproteobacteria bacterium]|nr:hypothetical protein [Alphaproteobacteria bacterium]
MKSERTHPGPWLLGLDAGTDSIGWSVFRLDAANKPIRLLSGGVRLFDWGREKQTKFSLNRSRGMTRRNRRRLRARKWRRDRLIQLLAAVAIAPPNDPPIDVWELRARATRVTVEKSELAACLLHMVRHRGFKSTKLTKQNPEADKEAAEEEGRWEASEKNLRAEMAGEKVNTVSQLFARRVEKARIEKHDPVLRARRGLGDVPTRKLIREDFVALRAAQER